MTLEEIEAQIATLKAKKTLTTKEQIDLRKLEKERNKIISPVESSGVFVTEDGNYDNSRVAYIDVEKIEMNPNQPRKVFDVEKLNELSESIKLHGLLQPIVVSDINGRYTLLAGERRLRAHKIANIDKIKAIVVEAKSDIELKELAIIENIQREDLNCIEEAISFKELQDMHGYSIRQLVERLNLDKNYIFYRLKIMEFTPEQIEFIIEKNLFTVSLLNAILGCDKGQHKKLLEDMAENKLTVSMIKSLATEKTEPTVAAKKEISSYPYGLKPINGVKIKNDKKKLAIEINYKDFAGKDTDKIKEYIQEIIEQSIKK